MYTAIWIVNRLVIVQCELAVVSVLSNTCTCWLRVFWLLYAQVILLLFLCILGIILLLYMYYFGEVLQCILMFTPNHVYSKYICNCCGTVYIFWNKDKPSLCSPQYSRKPVTMILQSYPFLNVWVLMPGCCSDHGHVLEWMPPGFWHPLGFFLFALFGTRLHLPKSFICLLFAEILRPCLVKSFCGIGSHDFAWKKRVRRWYYPGKAWELTTMLIACIWLI